MDADTDDTKRPEPRNLQSIFDDLRALAQSDGALHDTSVLMYRDWVVAIDAQEGKVADDPDKRWSATKLNSNEFMLLLGLMVQSSSDRISSVIAPESEFEERADKLLQEFHDRLTLDSMEFDDPAKIGQKLGAAAREGHLLRGRQLLSAPARALWPRALSQRFRMADSERRHSGTADGRNRAVRHGVYLAADVGDRRDEKGRGHSQQGGSDK